MNNAYSDLNWKAFVEEWYHISGEFRYEVKALSCTIYLTIYKV